MDINKSVFLNVIKAAVVTFFCGVVLVRAEPSAVTSISSEHSFAEHVLHAKQDIILIEKYLADISIHTPQELFDILERADTLLENGTYSVADSSPVVFLLHGDEARILFKAQYENNKSIVDLAAKLSAFNVVDIKVCDIWMQKNNLYSNDLQPFVGIVGNAITETKRLVTAENYKYF
ncbi:DsrE family protein [bacterium]|nr:DsrE family protein [bacterium]